MAKRMHKDMFGRTVVFKAPSNAWRDILILNISTLFFLRIETILVRIVIVTELTTMRAMGEVRSTESNKYRDNQDNV